MRDTTTTAQLMRLLELWDQGHGYAAIGRTLGMSAQLVGYYVRQHRTPRPPGRPPALFVLASRHHLTALRPTPRPDSPARPPSRA